VRYTQSLTPYEKQHTFDLIEKAIEDRANSIPALQRFFGFGALSGASAGLATAFTFSAIPGVLAGGMAGLASMAGKLKLDNAALNRMNTFLEKTLKTSAVKP
jgi:hypothetical protein